MCECNGLIYIYVLLDVVQHLLQYLDLVYKNQKSRWPGCYTIRGKIYKIQYMSLPVSYNLHTFEKFLSVLKLLFKDV